MGDSWLTLLFSLIGRMEVWQLGLTLMLLCDCGIIVRNEAMGGGGGGGAGGEIERVR